jgi:hypothetical protein
VLDEADILRGDIPRSKYIERALLMFNAYVRKNGRIALVQDASSVPTPEHLMTVDSPAFVEVNSPQNPHTTTVLTLEEDAAPVTS